MERTFLLNNLIKRANIELERLKKENILTENLFEFIWSQPELFLILLRIPSPSFQTMLFHIPNLLNYLINFPPKLLLSILHSDSACILSRIIPTKCVKDLAYILEDNDFSPQLLDFLTSLFSVFARSHEAQADYMNLFALFFTLAQKDPLTGNLHLCIYDDTEPIPATYENDLNQNDQAQNDQNQNDQNAADQNSDNQISNNDDQNTADQNSDNQNSKEEVEEHKEEKSSKNSIQNRIKKLNKKMESKEESEIKEVSMKSRGKEISEFQKKVLFYQEKSPIIPIDQRDSYGHLKPLPPDASSSRSVIRRAARPKARPMSRFARKNKNEDNENDSNESFPELQERPDYQYVFQIPRTKTKENSINYSFKIQKEISLEERQRIGEGYWKLVLEISKCLLLLQPTIASPEFFNAQLRVLIILICSKLQETTNLKLINLQMKIVELLIKIPVLRPMIYTFKEFLKALVQVIPIAPAESFKLIELLFDDGAGIILADSSISRTLITFYKNSSQKEHTDFFEFITAGLNSNMDVKMALGSTIWTIMGQIACVYQTRFSELENDERARNAIEKLVESIKNLNSPETILFSNEFKKHLGLNSK